MYWEQYSVMKHDYNSHMLQNYRTTSMGLYIMSMCTTHSCMTKAVIHILVHTTTKTSLHGLSYILVYQYGIWGEWNLILYFSLTMYFHVACVDTYTCTHVHGVRSCDVLKTDETPKLDHAEFKAKASHLTTTTLCYGSYNLPSHSSVADEAWYWLKRVLHIEWLRITPSL